MIWSHLFEDRLREWNDLRQNVQSLDAESCLMMVNDWWMRCPISTQHIAWEDWVEWPDPWELLLDNTWCDLTRSMGITYTLGLLFRDDIENVYIIDSNEGIMVEVGDTKYRLGYCFGDLHATSDDLTITRSIDAKKLKHYKSQ